MRKGGSAWLLCLIETGQQGPWGVIVAGRHLDIGASASGWRHGPRPSVLGNRPSEAGGQGVTGWPDTGRVLQPGCEEWLHRPSVASEATEQGKADTCWGGWKEKGQRQPPGRDPPGHPGRGQSVDEDTRPGGRGPTPWAGSVFPGLGEPQTHRHLVSGAAGPQGVLHARLIFVKATPRPRL